MITNIGKEIIAKYLMGTSPAYASYIAMGCGAKPRLNVNQLLNASSSGTLVTVTSTTGLWVGAKITKISGTGTLGSDNTIVTAVNSSTTFTVNVAPTLALSSATLSIQADPTKTVLDFEMFRIPIVSRGYINEDGLDKIVLTAELPTEERYEFSEIGIFSAGSNSLAGASDSKVLYAFTQDEQWEHHTSTASTAIPSVFSPLDSANNDIIDVAFDVFQSNADNRTFNNQDRLDRYERSRFLNNIILMVGDDANLSRTVLITDAVGNGTTITYTTALDHTLSAGDVITISGINPSGYNLSGVTVASVTSSTTFTVTNSTTGSYVSGGQINTTPHFIINANSNHIHLTGTTLNLDRNSPSDLIKLAFAVVSKDGSSSVPPDNVKILVEFASGDIPGAGEFARMEIDVTNGTGVGEYNLSTNRYLVIQKQLQELYKTPGFTWNTVRVVKIYASTIVSGTPTDDYYICLDAIRLDNVSTFNPLYGMTGYSIVQNTDAETVVKSANTTNYVEFRFALGVA
jgi:hypothetical protein